MVITEEKLNKSARAEKCVNVFEAVYWLVSVSSLIASIYTMSESDTLTRASLSYAGVFVATLLLSCFLPDIKTAAKLGAVGLKRGQTVYIACPEISLDVEETEITNIHPLNSSNPLSILEPLHLCPLSINLVGTANLFLTREEAQEALNESIDNICNEVQSYAGCEEPLTNEAKHKVMNGYLEYMSNRMLAKSFGGRKYVDPDWLSGLAEYIWSSEIQLQATAASKKAAEEEALEKERILNENKCKHKEFLKSFIS